MPIIAILAGLGRVVAIVGVTLGLKQVKDTTREIPKIGSALRPFLIPLTIVAVIFLVRTIRKV